MGGAVALLLHKKDPSFWNGALLVAPMCKVSLSRFLYNQVDTQIPLITNKTW